MSRGTQLELFPPGPDIYGPEPDPRKIVVERGGAYNDERWICVRCRRGGMRAGSVAESSLRYARTKHRCRPFATDMEAH